MWLMWKHAHAVLGLVSDADAPRLPICSGAAAISRATEQLMQMDGRIDRLKQQLYFPAVQGYKYAHGRASLHMIIGMLHMPWP